MSGVENRPMQWHSVCVKIVSIGVVLRKSGGTNGVQAMPTGVIMAYHVDLYPELFVVQAEIAVHGNIIIPGFVLSVLQLFIL